MNAYTIDNAPAHPKVSIIMLVYNSARFLHTSISAILRQKTDFDIQLVLSDDCSTDKDTVDLCRKYVNAFPDKITLICHKENHGIPRNFLDALSVCRGQYIAMCDADDYWCDKHKLQIMVDYMDRHPECALSFHRVINYYEDNGTKSLSNGNQHKNDYGLADLCRGNFITNCSVLYRKTACSVIPDEIADILLCDYAMHLLTAMNGSIHYFKKPMAVYRKRADALWTGVKATRRYRDALKVREFGMKLLKSQPFTDNYMLMVDNYTANALSCLATAKSEGATMDDIRHRLKQLHPEWSEQALEEKIAERISNRRHNDWKTQVLNVTSDLRAFVSRFVPLPKIKPLIHT